MAPHFYIRDYLSDDDSKIFVRRLTVYFEGKIEKGITINMWSEDPFKGEEGWVEIRIIRQQWDRLLLPAAVLLTFFPTKHSSNRLFLQPLSLSTREGVTWFFFFFFPFFFSPYRYPARCVVLHAIRGNFNGSAAGWPRSRRVKVCHSYFSFFPQTVGLETFWRHADTHFRGPFTSREFSF